MKIQTINNKHCIECDVVMLPTNKESIICASVIGLHITESMISNVPAFSNQHLYILSNDEIKESDYQICIDPNNPHYNLISQKPNNAVNSGAYKKIIATTDNSLWLHDDTVPYPKTKTLTQIPQSFIEHFINEYNKGNVVDKVLVEVEEKQHFEPNKEKRKDKLNGVYYKYHLKLNQSNEISILTEQKQSYSREEVVKLMNRAIDIGYNYCKNNENPKSRKSINKWINQNLK